MHWTDKLANAASVAGDGLSNQTGKHLQTILKTQKFMSRQLTFKLWLEFEEVDPANWDIENEFCNIHVDLEDGRHYGITVWTYNYLETGVNEDKKSGQNLSGLYQKPPDLFVKELTRQCIEQTIGDLLKMGDLEKVLNPSIYDNGNCK